VNAPKPLPPLWPGITGPDCYLCSGAVRAGVREVKVQSAACAVHWRAGLPLPPPETGGGR
jgi:hypothetical protein